MGWVPRRSIGLCPRPPMNMHWMPSISLDGFPEFCFISIIPQTSPQPNMPQKNKEKEQWFTENLLPHENMLRGWLHSRFHSIIDIDDIVQEAYLKVLEARENGMVTAPKAFLFATARNLALNAVRAAGVRGENKSYDYDYDQGQLFDENADVRETVSRNQKLEILTMAIQSLPERCRQIFTLRKVYGMPQRDIADLLGISPRTVNAQISIGINKCAEFVNDHCKGNYP